MSEAPACLGCARINSDLWREVHALLNGRKDQVLLSKVKGHATCKDVSKGLVFQRDKHGNDGADSLATAAAKQQSLPAHVVRDVQYRKQVVKEIQLMMCNILAARHQQAVLSAVAGSDSNSCSSSTESASSDSESHACSCDCSSNSSSSSQSSIALHSGSDHPT